MANLGTFLNKLANSHYVHVVAFALGVLIGATVLLSWPGLTLAPDEDGQPMEVMTETVAVPVRLTIPSIGLDSAFEGPLGLNADQTVEVPESYEAVGWYEYGPKPGEVGPAVILGHVDSYQGPAVFYSLGQLKRGDQIQVEREDGTTATFVVIRLQHTEQSEFPTAEVYGDIDYAGLRLVTCSGTYDRGEQVYSHNLIVYAELVE